MLIRCDGPLFYPNANAVKEPRARAERRARVVVLDLEVSIELDVQSADMLLELAGRAAARRDRAAPHPRARAAPRRSCAAPGVTDQVSVEAAPR